ncbi:MAG: putative esterase [Ktedonobacterales bacterium]|jgi:enterochelin esterase family protein|nr:MAG: putative esterase [Ktedonobacterales bacterium]
MTAITIEMPVFESQALAENPLGDPAARRLPVVLPPGYARAKRRYPVIVGLTGFTGKGIMLLNEDAWQPNLVERLERLYAAGMPHAIFVLPDCFTRYGGSQYLNSAATGRYEDYVIDEIVPWVDAHYRTIAAPEGRGVFGKSSGGYGSMILGMRHPEVFGALACHSGDMAFDLCYGKDFPAFCNSVNKEGGVEAWWQQFAAQVKKKSSDYDALNILAMAACYSPDADAPLGIGLPVDLHTCERIPAVWARWLEWDPVELLDRYGENLRQLRLLYMDCGTRDEFSLHFGARQMAKRLSERGIAYEYEEFDDGHMSIQYRYDVSLPKLARALATS